MPGHLPSYTRSEYWPSPSRHDCQLPWNTARDRSEKELNWASPSAATPRHVVTVKTRIGCHPGARPSTGERAPVTLPAELDIILLPPLALGPSKDAAVSSAVLTSRGGLS